MVSLTCTLVKVSHEQHCGHYVTHIIKSPPHVPHLIHGFFFNKYIAKFCRDLWKLDKRFSLAQLN